MKVEQACRLSADGTAKTKEKVKNKDGSIWEVSLFARFNEIQGKYTVTQYYKNQKIETAFQFRNPHKLDGWRPSRRFSSQDQNGQQIKSEYCLYLLVSKEKYQFKLGLTNNIYTRIYQLRLMWGEFDLESSCIVYGDQEHLSVLENTLHFIFEDYRLSKQTPDESAAKEWFDLDCFWYAKNEIRRMNSFREERIFRVFEGIDLNAFIVEEADKLTERVDLD